MNNTYPSPIQEINCLLPGLMDGRVGVMTTFSTRPDRYVHWKLKIDGPIARLLMDVDQEKPFRAGYKLKLNSYDLGVDIELADAVQRLRFEHPEVSVVVVTSAKDRIFCAGA